MPAVVRRGTPIYISPQEVGVDGVKPLIVSLVNLDGGWGSPMVSFIANPVKHKGNIRVHVPVKVAGFLGIEQSTTLWVRVAEFTPHARIAKPRLPYIAVYRALTRKGRRTVFTVSARMVDAVASAAHARRVAAWAAGEVITEYSVREGVYYFAAYTVPAGRMLVVVAPVPEGWLAAEAVAEALKAEAIVKPAAQAE